MRYTIFQPQSIHELGHRENQEDSLYPPQKTATTADRLFIVCDGMGGHDSGEVASSLVTDVISSFLQEKMQTDEPLTDELLQDAIDAHGLRWNAERGEYEPIEEGANYDT